MKMDENLLHFVQSRRRVLPHVVLSYFVPQVLGDLTREATLLYRVQPSIHPQSPFLRTRFLAVKCWRVGPDFENGLKIEGLEELQDGTHRWSCSGKLRREEQEVKVKVKDDLG